MESGTSCGNALRDFFELVFKQKMGVSVFALLCVGGVVNAAPIDIQTVTITSDNVGWGAGVNSSGQVAFSMGAGRSVMISDYPYLGAAYQYASSNSYVHTPAINNAGKISYGDGGIWIDHHKVVKSGDMVPGSSDISPGTQTFRNVSSYSNLSDDGETLFYGETSLGKHGLWMVNGAGEVVQIAVNGGTAPDSDGAKFAGIGQNAINSNGDLVFIATLNDSANTKGIWRQMADGTLERIFIDSITATSSWTGLPTEAPLDLPISQLEDIAIDGDGNVIFAASVYPPPGIMASTGIWRVNGSNAELIASSDGPASISWNLAANALGQVAFMSGDRWNTHDQSVWATDLSGELNLIAIQGQLLEVMEGDFRTIASVNFAPMGLSDSGKIAFSAFFDDGSSGIFLATFDHGQGSVPSPGTLPLLLIGILAVPLARNRSWARSSHFHVSVGKDVPTGNG